MAYFATACPNIRLEKNSGMSLPSKQTKSHFE